MSGHNIHTVPINDLKEHNTNGIHCECSPEIRLICEDCDDGCWKCEGGHTVLTPAEAKEASDVLVIVHNAWDGRE